MQDQVAAKNVELGRVPSEDNEADLGTKYLERGRIKKCVTKMEMLFAGAWLENSCLWFRALKCSLGGRECWTIGVVLLVTVGVLLLSCACASFDPHLPTGNVLHVTTREPTIAKATEVHESEIHARW